MRERNAAQVRGAREVRGHEAQGRDMRGREAVQARTGRERMGRENGAFRSNARMQPPAARAHEAPRFSNARPMQHVAQPTIGRSSPVNARAQAPMPHAAPAMPHAGGGAPHINAAPRGGGPAGGGRDHQGH
jgi:hypothetical protein